MAFYPSEKNFSPKGNNLLTRSEMGENDFLLE